MKSFLWLLWNVFLLAATCAGFIYGNKSAHAFMTAWVWVSLAVALIASASTDAMLKDADTAKVLRAEHTWVWTDIAFDLAVCAILICAGAWTLGAVYGLHTIIMVDCRSRARRIGQGATP